MSKAMTGPKPTQRRNFPIFVPNLLQTPEKRITLTVDRYFEGLETLTPVRGTVRITHRTSYLDVEGQADAIASLTCDRCLCQYNQRLQVDLSEPIWLRNDAETESGNPDWLDQELDDEDEIVESTSPQGHFDGEQWLYEQMCLAIPLQCRCRPDCEGIAIAPSEEPQIDSRWAALAKLKQEP